MAPWIERYGIVAVDRTNPKGLTNRAGNLPDVAPVTAALAAFCVRPFEQMYIAYDGTAVLCCQDWTLSEVMGDTKITPLLEIWRGAIYRKKREELIMCRRDGLCAKCDFPGV